MELSDFSFLADENIAEELVQFIKSQNIKVISVREEGWHGYSDALLVQVAEEKNLVLLTHDSDFGKIIFTNQGIKIGIVFLRPGHIDPQFHVYTFSTLLATSLSLQPPFILVVERAGNNLKIRKRLL